MSLKIALFLLDLVLPVATGYALARWVGIRRNLLDPMMTVGILGVAPVLGLLSFWVVRIDMGLIWLPLLGVAMQLFAAGAGSVRAQLKPHGPLEKGSYMLSAVLSNRGLVGGLSVFILLGEEGYAYSRLVILLNALVLYGMCFPMAQRFRARHQGLAEGRRWRAWSLFNRNQIALVGVAGGFLLNFAGVPRPDVFRPLFKALIHGMAWLMLVPVGTALDLREMREHCWHVADLLPIKFLLTPLFVAVLGSLVGLERSALVTVVILACSPTAVNAVVATKLFELNVHVAIAAFVLTTSVYLLAVFPIILALWALAG